MQAAPARYVSVSELYSTDEVELLLDEIRELEPTSCRGEDVQDFEIAGSGCGGGAGGRSPAGTSLTERSWDSHAQYRRSPPPRPAPLAPLYCATAYLASAEGLLTASAALCSAAAAAALWAGAGARLPPPARPLALAALCAALLLAALFAVRLTQLHRLMPLDWAALGAACGAAALLAQAAGSSVLLRAALQARAPPAPLLAAAGLGYAAALPAGGLAALLARRRWAARARRPQRGAYRAVPTASPAPALAPSPAARRAPL